MIRPARRVRAEDMLGATRLLAGILQDLDRTAVAGVSRRALVGADGGQALPPLLRLGSSGKNVILLQRRLDLHGADLVEDGIFGPVTEQAVRGFQQGHLLQVDGVVGPQTWTALLQAPPAVGRTSGTVSARGVRRRRPVAAAVVGQTLPPLVTVGVGPFQQFVDRGLVDDITGLLLNRLLQFPPRSFAQETGRFAHQELSVGNLIGIIDVANARAIRAKLHQSHQPQFDALTSNPLGAFGVTPVEDAGHVRSYILLQTNLLAGATTAAGAEFAMLVIAHELVHHRNRVPLARPKSTVSRTDYADPTLARAFGSGVFRTREVYISELAARHAAFHVRNDLRGVSAAVQPGQLYAACIDFGLQFGSFLDVGYMKALDDRDKAGPSFQGIPAPSKHREQVALWMRTTAEQSFHNDPTQDGLAKALFLQDANQAVITGFAAPTATPDGLA